MVLEALAREQNYLHHEKGKQQQSKKEWYLFLRYILLDVSWAFYILLEYIHHEKVVWFCLKVQAKRAINVDLDSGEKNVYYKQVKPGFTNYQPRGLYKTD